MDEAAALRVILNYVLGVECGPAPFGDRYPTLLGWSWEDILARPVEFVEQYRLDEMDLGR